MKAISYNRFSELISFLKNSINPTLPLYTNTIKMWYDIYFRFYSEEQIIKVFKFLAENNIDINLHNIKTAFIEFYGYFLPEEVNHCLKIMKQAKSEGKNISPDYYPKLKEKYDIPNSEAWKIAYDEFLALEEKNG